MLPYSIDRTSNFSCETYRGAIQIQEVLDTGNADNMRQLYGKCRGKMRKQRIIAMFVGLPIIRDLYRKQIKKRWN